MEKEELRYENGLGGFRQEGTEYWIQGNEKTTPLPWSHIIANEHFGTIVTANGGGYIWSGNSQMNKITKWSNDCVEDAPSERLVLHWGEKKWNLLPYDTLQSYQIIYGWGYAIYRLEAEIGIIETRIYVPRHRKQKVYDIRIEGNDVSSAFLEYRCLPVLGVARELTKKHLVIWQEGNKVKMQNHYRECYADEVVSLCFSEKLVRFEKEEEEVKCWVEASPRMRLEVSCETNTILEEKSQAWKEITENEWKEVQNFWKQKRNRVIIQTPVESMNLMMNGWLFYQTLCCRLWARTSFYQAGGAFGFRDQLQDALSMLWFEDQITRSQILYHAAHQFEEGDVLHWWHAEQNNGTRTRYSDDLLWLPYVLSQYVKHTGDVSVLEERVSYVKGEELNENEMERYMVTTPTEAKDTLYNHAKRAIEYGVKLAENGLPQMRGGDWNDGMNQIKGQSIWLGFFIDILLTDFQNVCAIKQDDEAIQKYEMLRATLRRGLEKYSWDGKWFRRAYFADGTPLGSYGNEECKIDSISQSWAVISGAVAEEKCLEAMESVDRYLVDRENRIMKLLTPPFDKASFNPGYIKEYIPGVRENGGQYTHGAIWSIIANCILKKGNRAEEYFRMLNPIEHTKTMDGVLRYKVEPYVMAADVYASPNMMGRGGWTWYTGSSSWFYLAGLEFILGLQKIGNRMKLNPCIPKEWDEYEIRYWFQETLYQITVKNPHHVSYGITQILLDGEKLLSQEWSLQNDQKVHQVIAVLEKQSS